MTPLALGVLAVTLWIGWLSLAAIHLAQRRLITQTNVFPLVLSFLFSLYGAGWLLVICTK